MKFSCNITSFPRFFSRVVHWELRQVFPLLGKLLVSGQISEGQFVEKFSTFVQKKFSVLEAIPLNSGSSAIQLALETCKQVHPHRNRVILPIYICPSVIRSVKRAGLTPLFVPIGKALTLEPKGLKTAITQEVLAVIVPHLYGYPAQISECVQIVRETDPSIFVIDDAAPAFDISIQHRKLGTWGDVGIFSFGPSKKLTATGGGVLLISNAEILPLVHERIKILPEPSTKIVLSKFLYFWWNFVCIRFSPTLNYWAQKYLHFIPQIQHSHNSIQKMSNLDAALILWLWKRKDQIYQRRSQIMEYYIKGLHEIADLSFPQERSPDFGVSRLYIRTVGSSLQKNQHGSVIKDHPLISFLRLQGIRAGYGYKLSDDDLGKRGSELRNEHYQWLDELIWLPIDHKRDMAQYDVVITAIQSFFKTYHQHSIEGL